MYSINKLKQNKPPAKQPSAPRAKKNINIVKEHSNLKEPAITGLSPKMSKKLREHSKEHKGMTSKHIQTMLKHLRNKKSFKVAHELAVKEDSEKKSK